MVQEPKGKVAEAKEGGAGALAKAPAGTTSAQRGRYSASGDSDGGTRDPEWPARSRDGQFRSRGCVVYRLSFLLFPNSKIGYNRRKKKALKKLRK